MLKENLIIQTKKSFSYAINPKGPLKGFFLFTLIVLALDLDGFFLVTEDGVRVIRCRSMTPTIRLLSFNPLWRSIFFWSCHGCWFFSLSRCPLSFFIIFIVVIVPIIIIVYYVLFFAKIKHLFSWIYYLYPHITATSGRVFSMWSLPSLKRCHPFFVEYLAYTISDVWDLFIWSREESHITDLLQWKFAYFVWVSNWQILALESM